MRRPWLLLIALILAGGCTRFRFVIDAIPADEDLRETTVLDDGGGPLGRAAKIALIDVRGLMADARRSEVLSDGENPVSRFAEMLRRAARDAKVRAVIVRINSPGGTVTASDVMYRELTRFRETTGKPAVILMGDVAASGGYYLACAGDEIIAHPTTVTGSVGVIMQTINFSEGMRRIGIKADAITSGPNKAVGSPFEPMPPEHRALLQEMVNEFFEQFVATVRAHRDLTTESFELVTDGRVVTGRRAAEIGLVDRLGDLHDAFDAARQRAGVSGARLVKYHRPLEHVGSAYAATPAPVASVSLVQLNLDAAGLLDRVGFYYLWDPHAW